VLEVVAVGVEWVRCVVVVVVAAVVMKEKSGWVAVGVEE
jgi:hypothetical protein